ncbi:hypothetical protein D9M71_658130 [compost metagenome]
MAGGGGGQRRVAAHVRVVAQAGTRPLRLGDPGQALAVDHPQAHQFAGFLGQAVEDRLHHVSPAVGQVTEAQRHQLGGQLVAAALRVLAHVAQADQLGEHAVGGALGDLQLVGQGLHGHPARVGGQAFQKTQCAFDLTACHVGYPSVRCGDSKRARVLAETARSGAGSGPATVKMFQPVSFGSVIGHPELYL